MENILDELKFKSASNIKHLLDLVFIVPSSISSLFSGTADPEHVHTTQGVSSDF